MNEKTPHWWFDKPLWAQVLVGLAAGVVMGMLLSQNTGLVPENISADIVNWVAFPGYFFLAMLKMIVVPLVLVSVMCGIAGSGTAASVKKVGTRVLGYFALTTVVAVAIGSLMANLIRPGSFIDSNVVENTMGSAVAPEGIVRGGGSFGDLPQQLIGILPTNPFQALADGSMLQVVIFAAILGASLLTLPKAKSKPLLDILTTTQETVMVFVNWLMKLAPYAVFGLITKVTAQVGLDALTGLAAYVGTVILALLAMGSFQVFLVYTLAKVKPSIFLEKAREAQLVAFSTSSSAATMPVTLKIAEDKMGVKPEIARFTVPLGTTINMDGTAIMQGVATVFIAQVYGVDLSVADLAAVVLTATMASIGAAGVPGVGLITLALVLEQVGLPVEGIAMIIGVDRLLDMVRTAVNVTGDATVSLIVAELEGQVDKTVFGDWNADVMTPDNVETDGDPDRPSFLDAINENEAATGTSDTTTKDR